MGLSIAPHAGGPVPRQAPSFETPGFFGGDTGITYEELQARKKIARELMGGNGQIRSVGEGINSAAKSVAGALLKKRAQTEEDKQRSAFNESFNSVVPGMFGGGVSGTMSTKGSPYADAIASVESAGSGDYSAVGPQTPKGRAYGRYQVMDFNIPAWTEKYVGRRMTPEEFLRDPAAQDAVFNGEFGSYVQKYGNPQDAASMWFSGRPMAEAGNASDGYTTVPEYVSKFDRALGGRASSKGVQVAQAGGVDPSVIQKLAELAGSPYASPGQKAIVNALLGQKIQAMQPPAPPKPTALQQNYEYALSLGMTPEEARAWVKGGVNIDMGNDGPKMGTIPQGYTVVEDPDSEAGYRMVPIPGGPEDTSEEDANREDAKQTSAQFVLDEIGIARELIEGQDWKSPATGIFGKLFSGIDSTRGGKLKNRLETIKANIGFDKLQAMREASPTGGALGQVSEFENRLLQAVFGSLEQAQGEEDLLYNLGRLEQIYDVIINGVPDGQGGFRAMTDEEATELYQRVIMAPKPKEGGESPLDNLSEEDRAFMKEMGFE